jgi:hypothetical protein
MLVLTKILYSKDFLRPLPDLYNHHNFARHTEFQSGYRGAGDEEVVSGFGDLP